MVEITIDLQTIRIISNPIPHHLIITCITDPIMFATSGMILMIGITLDASTTRAVHHSMVDMVIPNLLMAMQANLHFSTNGVDTIILECIDHMGVLVITIQAAIGCHRLTRVVAEGTTPRLTLVVAESTTHQVTRVLAEGITHQLTQMVAEGITHQLTQMVAEGSTHRLTQMVAEDTTVLVNPVIISPL